VGIIFFGGGMTMRNSQAKWFLKHLQEKYPHLIEKYEKLYRFSYQPEIYEGNYSPQRSYVIKMYKKFDNLVNRYNISR
jgi:hypothetical protein